MEGIEVRVRGRMDKDWSEWLGGLSIAHTAQGDTVLTGSVRDQAAVYGLLFQLSNLGLRLVSLTCEETGARADEEVG